MRPFTKFICAVSGIILVICTLLMKISIQIVQPLDDRIRGAVNASRTPTMNHFFINFTQIFNAKETLIWVVIVMTLSWIMANQRFTWQVTISMGSVLIINRLIKEWVRRPRPATHLLMHYAGYSFPSGHSSAAAVIIGCLILLAWRVGKHRWLQILGTACAVLLIILVGYSRIYVGAHFPSDVLAGWCLGTFVLTTIQLCFNRKKSHGES